MLKRVLLFAAVGIALSYATACDTDYERDLTDKIVLLTGGARGIGKSTVKSLLDNECKQVIILDREEELGKQTSAEFNAIYGDHKTVFIKCNIPADLDEVLEYVLNQYEIDIVVNNAGVINEYDLESTMNTNVIGPLKISAVFYNKMRTDKGGKGGTIINISSISSYLRDPFMSNYKASKAAVAAFTRGQGHEYNYKRSCVRFIGICPGLTYTYMTEQQMVVDEQVDIFNKFRESMEWQGPDCVASAIVKTFQSAESGTIWDSIGCAEPTESPASQEVTSDYLESL